VCPTPVSSPAPTPILGHKPEPQIKKLTINETPQILNYPPLPVENMIRDATKRTTSYLPEGLPFTPKSTYTTSKIEKPLFLDYKTPSLYNNRYEKSTELLDDMAGLEQEKQYNSDIATTEMKDKPEKPNPTPDEIKQRIETATGKNSQAELLLCPFCSYGTSDLTKMNNLYTHMRLHNDDGRKIISTSILPRIETNRVNKAIQAKIDAKTLLQIERMTPAEISALGVEAKKKKKEERELEIKPQKINRSTKK
jgi:hypothetical protein